MEIPISSCIGLKVKILKAKIDRSKIKLLRDLKPLTIKKTLYKT